MEEIIKLIDSLKGLDDHYLIIAKRMNHPYFSQFLEAARVLKTVFSQAEYEDWLKEKMLLKQQKFEEKRFVQNAVETAACRFFAERYPNTFKAEAKVNPSSEKNVDCRFSNVGFDFNVEVKCADFVQKEKVDAKSGYKYSTLGRLSDRGADAKKAISLALDEVNAKKGDTIMGHHDIRKMDNNLKDFLLLTQGKLNPVSSLNEYNVLLIGCDNAEDFQEWFNYMFAEQGLFTGYSFEPPKNYDLVDAVVMTNLYDKHNRFFEKEENYYWTLEGGLNMLFMNQFARLEKKEAFNYFGSILPHHTDEFANYDVPGEAPEEVKFAVWVSNFIKDYLEEKRGLHYFSVKKNT
jgi:hypothetical protein